MKIKTTRFHYIPTKMSKIKMADNASVGKGTGQQVSIVGLRKDVTTLEKCLAVSYEVKFTFTTLPSNINP